MDAGRTCWVWALLAWVLMVPATAQAGERYYLLLFASQTRVRRPNLCHSFAVAVRDRGDGPSSPCLDSVTISWMPADMQIRTLCREPRVGVNLGIHETMGWALTTGQYVSLWGPYEVTAEVWDHAVAQAARLDSGRVRYKVLDHRDERDTVACIHAISDMIPSERRIRYPICCFGNPATHKLARGCWLRDEVLSSTGHDWLLEALGLAHYPLTRRRCLEKHWYLPDVGWRLRSGS